MYEETVLDQDPRTILIEELLQNITPYKEIILVTTDETVTEIYLRDFTPGSEFTLYGGIHIPARYQFPVNYVLQKIKEIGKTLNLPLLEIEYIDPHDIDADLEDAQELGQRVLSEPQLIISRTYSQQPKRTRELLAKNARNAGININILITNETEIKPFKDFFLKTAIVFDPEAVIEMIKAVQERPQELMGPLNFNALSKIPTVPEMLIALKGKSAMANFLIKLYTSPDTQVSEREKQALSLEIIRSWCKLFYPTVITSINANDFTWLGFDPTQIIDNLYETLSGEGYRVHVLDLYQFVNCTEDGKYKGHDYNRILEAIRKILKNFQNGDILIFRNSYAFNYNTYQKEHEDLTSYWSDRKQLDKLVKNATAHGILININGS